MFLKNEKFIIADYEIGLEWDCALQKELYGDAFQNIYTFFLDNNCICGEKVKPGVIRENLKRYNNFEHDIKSNLLENKRFRENLIRRGYKILFEYNKKINYLNSVRIDEISYNDFCDLYQLMKISLSMMAFNWITPNSEYKNVFYEILGLEEGNRIFFNTGIPSVVPHFKLLQLGIYKFAIDYIIKSKIRFEQFKDNFGCLLNFGFKDSALEDSNHINNEINNVLDKNQYKVENIVDKVKEIKEIKQRAGIKKVNAYRIIIDKYRSKLHHNKIDDILSICQFIEFINNEEELRHIYQMRAQRLVKKIVNYYGMVLSEIKFEDILFFLKKKGIA